MIGNSYKLRSKKKVKKEPTITQSHQRQHQQKLTKISMEITMMPTLE